MTQRIEVSIILPRHLKFKVLPLEIIRLVVVVDVSICPHLPKMDMIIGCISHIPQEVSQLGFDMFSWWFIRVAFNIDIWDVANKLLRVDVPED